MTETASEPTTEGTVEHALKHLPAFTGLYATIGLGAMGGCPYMLVAPTMPARADGREGDPDYKRGLRKLRDNNGGEFDAYAEYKKTLSALPAYNVRVGFNAILAFNAEYLRLLGTIESPIQSARVALLSAVEILSENEPMLSEDELQSLRLWKAALTHTPIV